MINDSERQLAYYCSREWALKKEAIHERSRIAHRTNIGICERCHLIEGKAVHHKTYARLYNEKLTDLVLLCDDCHNFIHGKIHVDPIIKTIKKMHNYMEEYPGTTFGLDYIIALAERACPGYSWQFKEPKK